MTKSTACTTTMFAFAGALAMAAPAKADEMQVSGTDIITRVESHLIPAAGDPTHGVAIDKWVGALNAPGLFDSMLGIWVGSAWVDLKQGHAEVKGSMHWNNDDGSIIGSYAVKATFAVDPKINAPKGTVEGTWEFTDGTGRFADVRGRGTVTGEFSGDNETDHWKGTITGFEKRASTQ